MKTHHLKIWPEYFDAHLYGKKTSEVRRNDRDFAEGDYLFLHCYDPHTKLYTGAYLTRQVIHITNLSTIGVFAIIFSGEGDTPVDVVSMSLAVAILPEGAVDELPN